jgi:hypothetical protein
MQPKPFTDYISSTVLDPNLSLLESAVRICDLIQKDQPFEIPEFFKKSSVSILVLLVKDDPKLGVQTYLTLDIDFGSTFIATLQKVIKQGGDLPPRILTVQSFDLNNSSLYSVLESLYDVYSNLVGAGGEKVNETTGY